MRAILTGLLCLPLSALTAGERPIGWQPPAGKADLKPSALTAPATRPAGCVCTDGCKCTAGTCPGSCPTEVSYAEAEKLVDKGERVTVFYQINADKGITGKYAVTHHTAPRLGPGRYVAFKDKLGRRVVELVGQPLTVWAGPPVFDPNCVGGR